MKVFGGAEGDRTPDLMTASHALSQLSYGPKISAQGKSAGDVRAMIEEDRVDFKRASSLRNPAGRKSASNNCCHKL